MAKSLKKRKFNAVDAILIILILAVATAGVVFFVNPSFFGKGDETQKETTPIMYEIRFSGVRNDVKDVLAECWSKGDIVKDKGSEYVIGELYDVRIDSSRVIGNDINGGSSKYYEYPDHSDVVLVIKADAEMTSNGRYSVGGRDVSMGVGIEVKLPYYTGTGYCIRLTENVDGEEVQSNE